MGRIVLVLVSVFVCQLCITVDAQVYVNSSCDGTNFNYTSGSVFENNLNLLFDILTPKSSTLEFYNSTLGNAPNKVYGLFQCRNDVPLHVCNECIKDATQRVIKDCPLSGEAAAYYYECTLWYADHNILSGYATRPSLYSWSYTNVSDYSEFAPVLANDLNGVIKNASSASPHFASSVTNLTLFQQLYSFAQCTPNIDSSECNNCLISARSELIRYSNTSVRGTAFFPSCQLRYDMSPFLNDRQSPPAPAPAPPSANVQDPGTSKKTSLKPGIIAAIAGCVSVGLLVLAVVLWICLCHKKPKEATNDVPPASATGLRDITSKSDVESIRGTEFVQYDFATLKTATGDFSDENKLGEGGFGIVYKGTLENRQQAIKRLSNTSGQGTKEFMAEARLLAKLQHKNLVKLVGFCLEGKEKLLVYEFMSNTSLDGFLFDPSKRTRLDWVTRYKIILGIARGLQYLHEDCPLTIIHRDLKPSNILLDKELNPKIADFGLAKLFDAAQKFGNTMHIIGTKGYMAPEYLLTGEYSDKSDVYSFGIMLLEIVSGHNNIIFYQSSQQQKDLPIHTWRLWNEGRSFDLTDPSLYNNCSSNEVMRCIQIGLLCLQEDAVDRPTMTRVVLMLTGNVDLPLPSTPAMSFPRYGTRMPYNGGQQSDQYSTTKSAVDDVAEDLYPRPR